MKEGLVNLPEDVVILERIGKGRAFRGLPISDIPETEANIINKSIKFIQQHNVEGNYKAAGVFCFEKKGDLVRYEVVSAKSEDNLQYRRRVSKS